jgi:hypothetical protein
LLLIDEEPRMDTGDMVFRSQTLNHDVDRAVLALAAHVGAPAGAVFRLFLETGLAQLRVGAPLPPKVEEASLVLRTVFIRVESDMALEAIALRRRIERWELVARVLRLSVEALASSINVSARSR